MFKPGEKVSVSPNKYGYHSMPLENAMLDTVTLVPTPESAEKRNLKWEDTFEQCPSDQLLLVALNPIEGFRQDMSCTAFRSFLVEMDYGPIADQLVYAKQIKLPYSAAIFSGNKSIHFLITLDQDLPSYKVYYQMAEWILNIATMADPLTKNPSRSIRIPGHYREPGKLQELMEIRGPVKLQDLGNWLKMHPEAKPLEAEKREISDTPIDLRNVKPWVAYKLANGLDVTQGRNRQWFAIACEFALGGYDEDGAIDFLRNYFVPDRDFREREWLTSIKSAFKYIHERK